MCVCVRVRVCVLVCVCSGGGGGGFCCWFFVLYFRLFLKVSFS